jgi:hypothetical protein
VPDIMFENKAVAFIDVMGFKQLVSAAVSDDASRHALESLIGALEMVIPVLDAGVDKTVPERLIPGHTYISDCIILSAPLADSDVKSYSGLETVVMRTIQLTHRLLDAGYLLRGGIAIGPVWHDKGNIVGPAYQEAYCLEHKGDEPRVVLSHSAAQHWSRGFGAGSRMCLLDGNTVMVNGVHDYYVPDRSSGGLERAFEKYSAIVTEKLTSGLSPQAHAKWEWFQAFLESEKSEAEKWYGA